MDIQQGAAVFLPPEPCLRELRQAAKRAIRGGKEARRFIVVREEMYYPGMLDQLLDKNRWTFDARNHHVLLNLGEPFAVSQGHGRTKPGKLMGDMRCVEPDCIDVNYPISF